MTYKSSFPITLKMPELCTLLQWYAINYNEIKEFIDLLLFISDGYIFE